MRSSPICLLALIMILAGAGAASGTTGAAAAPPTCLVQGTSYPSNMVALALLALTMSFDVVAIAYIINKLFPTAGIRDWINAEYWEIAKTAMLIVGIYAVLTLLGNVAVLIAPPGLVSAGSTTSQASSASSASSTSLNFAGMDGLVNGACTYLSGETAFTGTTLNYLFGLSEGIGAIKSTQVAMNTPIPLGAFGIPVEFDSGFFMSIYWNNMISSEAGQSTYQSMTNDLITLVVVPVTVAMEVQMTLLPILFALGLGALIPAGLFLRAFPFLRGIGGTLIAIGIGVSLIYPATLVLFNDPVTAALQGSAIPSVSKQAPALQVPQCSGDFVICGASEIVFSAISQFPGGGGGGDAILSMQTIFPALNNTLYYNSYVLLQFFLFILDLAIIFPLADNIAKMLGGKISLSIGGRLKLV